MLPVSPETRRRGPAGLAGARMCIIYVVNEKSAFFPRRRTGEREQRSRDER